MSNDGFKKLAKGLFGLVKDAVEDKIDDSLGEVIQDTISSVVPENLKDDVSDVLRKTGLNSNTNTSLNTNSIKNSNFVPDDKLETVPYEEGMYKKGTPQAAFRLAIKYFHANAESGRVRHMINELNVDFNQIITFNNFQNKNFEKREDFTNSVGKGKNYYSNKIYGTNDLNGYYNETLFTQQVDEVVYKKILSNRYIFEDLLYGLSFDTKNRKVNDDGSIDIRLDIKNDKDNKETISMYERNLTRDPVFASKLDVYAGDNYVTMHIDSNGFITEINKLRSCCLYREVLEGKINVVRTETECYKVEMLNEPIVIEKGDLDEIPPLLSADHDFSGKLSYSETKRLKDGDLITKLPDEKALIEENKFFKLFKDTGRVFICNLEMIYYPRKNEIDFKVGTGVLWTATLKEGKYYDWNLGCYEHIMFDSSKILKIVNDMPDFHRAKKEHANDVRVLYLGNGKWN